MNDARLVFKNLLDKNAFFYRGLVPTIWNLCDSLETDLLLLPGKTSITKAMEKLIESPLELRAEPIAIEISPQVYRLLGVSSGIVSLIPQTNHDRYSPKVNFISRSGLISSKKNKNKSLCCLFSRIR